MNSTTFWKTLTFFSAVIISSTALAITPEEEMANKVCKKPKFRDFTPAANAEVLPESDISFHVSRDADPLHVFVDIHGEKLPVKVENKVSFLKATSKLPAAVRDGFLRVHVSAKAADGECIGSDGWLLKITPVGATGTASVVQAEPQSAAAPVVAQPESK